MSIDEATPEMWDRLRTKYKALAEEEHKDFLEYPSVADPVESPVHYNTGSVECIDAIKASMSDTEFEEDVYDLKSFPVVTQVLDGSSWIGDFEKAMEAFAEPLLMQKVHECETLTYSILFLLGRILTPFHLQELSY